MKATLITARCFAVDLEEGDVIKLRSSFYEVSQVHYNGKVVQVFSDHLGKPTPVAELRWCTPVTVYKRKE